MLKIVFHTPQRIIQHGLECEAMHVLCIDARERRGITVIYFGDFSDIIVDTREIKSIEPYEI